MWSGIVLCLATWVLVQDLGFLGGLGTDPNSMIPLILLFSAGYLALVAAPQEEALPGTGAAARWRPVAVAGAVAVMVIGAAPMAAASVNRTADPIVAQALAGSSGQFDTAAPDFTLTSQDGHQVSLASLRGKVVLLTFLDPVCTTDCPLIAQEMRSADAMLGGRAAGTELVAVVANPTYLSTAYTRAFTAQEHLGEVPNWLFLTGSLSQLGRVWHHYGIEVENLPAGAMAAHNDLAFVIDAAGRCGRSSATTRAGHRRHPPRSPVLLASSSRQTMGRS